jgi:hypothetical protein
MADTELMALFETLNPQGTATVEDIEGNVYEVRTVLPARAQIVVMQKLHAISQMDLPDGFSLTTEDMVSTFMALAEVPGFLTAVADAFETAHPKAVAGARTACSLPDADAADLFPVEELATGLLPFVLRVVKKLLATMNPTLMQPQQSEPAA